jgi:hypothetical protein
LVAVSITETMLSTSFATRSKVRARVEHVFWSDHRCPPEGSENFEPCERRKIAGPSGDANASRRDGEPRDQRANGRRT